MTTRIPDIIGPITGGKHKEPFASPEFDVGKYGYVFEEYFIEGDADAFELAPGTEQTRDGKWTIRKTTQPAHYKTRILVLRPTDEKRFNGTVIVHWQNVTAGFERNNITEGEYLRGFAWVGVSAQKIGIDGFPPPRPNPDGLKTWDIGRYGSLHHPGDNYSYDIFTQAARVTGPKRPRGAIDPMGGLSVKRMIAAGGSQSAGRLRTYINGVQPIEHTFDGYVPYIDWASVSPVFERPDEVRTGAVLGLVGIMARRRSLIRDDLGVPVFVVNSETEVDSYFDSRQPDNDRYRFWEITGASHAPVPRHMVGNPDAIARAGTRIGDLIDPNWISYRPVYDAAIRHMHNWLTKGTLPPQAPKIIVEGTPPAIRRDGDGNAVGGIRLPDIAAPTSEHRGDGLVKPGGYQRGYLIGQAREFPHDKLKRLYPNAAAYMQAYDKAMKGVVDAGYVLADDVPTLRKAAEAWAQRLN